jgi:hypothetical protein
MSILPLIGRFYKPIMKVTGGLVAGATITATTAAVTVGIGTKLLLDDIKKNSNLNSPRSRAENEKSAIINKDFSFKSDKPLQTYHLYQHEINNAKATQARNAYDAKKPFEVAMNYARIKSQYVYQPLTAYIMVMNYYRQRLPIVDAKNGYIPDANAAAQFIQGFAQFYGYKSIDAAKEFLWSQVKKCEKTYIDPQNPSSKTIFYDVSKLI